jgi:hypothetical protein
MEKATDGQRTLEIDWRTAAPELVRFIHDPTFVTGLFGPLGCAKTASACLKVGAYGNRWPGSKIVVVRTTWPRLRDTSMEEFFKWFPKGVAGDYEATPKVFHMRTGAAYGPSGSVENERAHVMFRAMDDQKDIEDVLSMSVAAAWVDEPQGGLAPVGKTLQSEPGLDHNLFLHLLSRLGRQPGFMRMCWLTGNPPDPSHWIAKEFRYSGKGQPANPRSNYRLHLATKETNRRNLYHHFQGERDGQCRVCGRPFVPEERTWSTIHQQGDYYADLTEQFGVGTPLALRFIEGLWIPFKALKPFDISLVRYVSDLPEQGRPTIAQCFNTLAIDPAITKHDEGCRSSITLAGTPTDGLYRSLQCVWRNLSDHWSPYELCDAVLRWVEEFPVRKIAIEKVAWQSALKDIIEREARLRGVRLPYVELVPPRGDKLMRAHAWSGGVESGKILFDPTCQDLIACMHDVPMNKMAWDPVDATGLALSALPMKHAPRSSIKEAEDSPERKRVATYAPKTVPTMPARQPIPWRNPARDFNRHTRERARGYAVRV